MSSGDRLLAILQFFSDRDQASWPAESIAEELGLSSSTAYRYLKSLVSAQLLDQTGDGYVLGPGIVALYRKLQLHDPMMRTARPLMRELALAAGERSTIILCRLFHEQVMCVHQELHYGPQEPVGYEIGRPRPMFRGSASKVILANLPPRELRGLYKRNVAEVAAAGLGGTWDEFRAALKQIRRLPALVSHAEVDAGRVGIASPIFTPDKVVVGSISTVFPEDTASDAAISRMSVSLATSAHLIGAAFPHGAETVDPEVAKKVAG